MFLVDYKNIIFNYFNKGAFKIILPDDLKYLNPASENELADIEILKIALQSFEENGLVKKQEYKDGRQSKIIYILEKPLTSFEQSVYISGTTAGYITNTIQKLSNNNQHNCNPLKIEEKDILEILTLLVQTFDNQNNNSQKIQTHGLN